ncbi:diguanylate cyclase [Candidatus Sumerlaeota bacterium]|nr:diguanylate cyclase [Candidatus Sumerlaeota bacterium]
MNIDDSHDSANASMLLIVDGKPEESGLASQIISKGNACKAYSDVAQGIEWAQLEKPDVIIIDERCARMSALEAGRLLKAKVPYIPLVLYTEDPESDATRECLEMGGYEIVILKQHSISLALGQIAALLRTSSQIKQLMENNRRLNRLSVQDPLTGLFNHRHLLDWLDIEFKRSDRNAEPLSCIMIDIDHFKMINDSYGHKYGDFVLKTFSQIIQFNIRKVDIVGRYGGEEFLAILPATDLHGAINLAEKLRRIIENHSFREGMFETNLTASFGVASTSDERVASADQLLAMSDKALYISKESGRNRVSSVTDVDSVPVSENRKKTMMIDPKRRIIHCLTQYLDRSQSIDSTLRADGFQVLQSSSAETYIENIRQITSDILLIDANRQEEDWAMLEKVIPQYLKQNNATLILMHEDHEAPKPLGILQRTPRSLVHIVPLSRTAKEIKTLVKFKNLEADLRESNMRLKAMQRKLIRSERMKSLGEMSNGVAHELNNVLSIILGRAQVLSKGTSDAKLREGLDLIAQSALDGSKTLRRISEYFRIESPGQLETLHLSQILSSCLEFSKVRWRDEAHLKGINYDIVFEVPTEMEAWGSEPELCEVFTNIIFNALDAMQDGGVLSIIARTIGEEHRVTIRDTGSGMSEEVKSRIYDPFFTTKDEKGSGLGMNVVQNIVSRHRGRIEVESEEGLGSEFHIYLPKYTGQVMELPSIISAAPPEPVERRRFEPPKRTTAEPAAAEMAVVEPATAAKPDKGESLHVLIVDDEEAILQVFYDILADSNYDVDTANSGADALKLLDENTYQVIITDLGMPEVSGWDVARHAKETHPRCKVVLASGWGDNYKKSSLQNKGIDHILPKPVGIQALLSMMDTIEKQLADDQGE